MCKVSEPVSEGDMITMGTLPFQEEAPFPGLPRGLRGFVMCLGQNRTDRSAGTWPPTGASSKRLRLLPRGHSEAPGSAARTALAAPRIGSSSSLVLISSLSRGHCQWNMLSALGKRDLCLAITQGVTMGAGGGRDFDWRGRWTQKSDRHAES